MLFTTEDIQTRALNQVNLEIGQGEFVAIMGPSGCGKSTLLNILGTLDTPTSGKYFINGMDMTRMSEENVELPLIYSGVRKAGRKQQVMKVLEQMNMAHRAGHFPQQLSGGQQQRVAIARAIVTDCPLILADEPTGNLDSTNGAEVMAILQKLNEQGATIIMVTHSERDAGYAHRTIHLLDGRIVDRP